MSVLICFCLCRVKGACSIPRSKYIPIPGKPSWSIKVLSRTVSTIGNQYWVVFGLRKWISSSAFAFVELTEISNELGKTILVNKIVVQVLCAISSNLLLHVQGPSLASARMSILFCFSLCGVQGAHSIPRWCWWLSPQFYNLRRKIQKKEGEKSI